MSSWSISRARAWLFAVLFLSTFIFVRVYSNTPVFFFPDPADDSGYLAYTQSMLRGERLNFDWCDPAVTDIQLRSHCKLNLEKEGRAHAYNMYTPGPAIALLPVTALGHFLDRTGIFTPTNIDPLLFWSIVGTFFLFAIGTFFLFECTLYFLKDLRRSWWLTVLFIVGNPIVYYVMRRPLMSHATEFFLFFAAVYFLIRTLRSAKPLIPALLLGMCAGLMLITRINNIHIPAFFGILLLFWPGQIWADRRLAKVLGYIAGAVPFIFIFLWINYLQKGTFLYSTQSYYEAYTIGFFLKLYAVNPLRVLTWFFGPHWGLLWLLPMSAYQFFYFFRFRRELLAFVRGARLVPLALIAVVFALHLNMMANGPSAMSYAYRYVFTYYFLLHVGFLAAVARFGMPVNEATRTGFRKPFQALLVASMLVSSAHILNYETKVPELRPQIPLVAAKEEWIFHPFWRDTVIWTTPYFAFHSFIHMAKGNPLMAVAASPLAAFPIIALADTPLLRLPGMSSAVDFYRSETRKVHSLWNLMLTYQFQLLFAFAAAVAFWITGGRRTL